MQLVCELPVSLNQPRKGYKRMKQNCSIKMWQLITFFSLTMIQMNVCHSPILIGLQGNPEVTFWGNTVYIVENKCKSIMPPEVMETWHQRVFCKKSLFSPFLSGLKSISLWASTAKYPPWTYLPSTQPFFQFVPLAFSIYIHICCIFLHFVEASQPLCEALSNGGTTTEVRNHQT